jgi:hypothetical protein
LNDRAVEVFRTVLTVVGILLLVIFGGRAVAQARNMKIAGGNHKNVFAVGTNILSVLGFEKTQPVRFYEPRPISFKLPSQIQPVAPITTTNTSQSNISDTASSGRNGQGSTQSVSNKQTKTTNNGLSKTVDTVNNVTGNTQQVVNNITKNTSNDFISLWP